MSIRYYFLFRLVPASAVLLFETPQGEFHFFFGQVCRVFVVVTYVKYFGSPLLLSTVRESLYGLTSIRLQTVK